MPLLRLDFILLFDKVHNFLSGDNPVSHNDNNFLGDDNLIVVVLQRLHFYFLHVLGASKRHGDGLASLDL